MKNLTLFRFCICAVVFTLFSTSVAWGAKLCQSGYTGTVYTFGSKTVKVSVGTIGTNMYRVVFEADFEMAGSNTYVNTSENNNLSLESTTKTILDGGHRIFFDFPSTFAPNFKNGIMVRPAAQPASDYTLSGESVGSVDWSQTTAECAALMGDDCSGWSTESLPGGNPFTKGYIYDLSSDAGGNVNISVRILDTQTGWGAPQLYMLNEYGGEIGPNPNMTWNGSTQTATHTLTGQSGTIYFKVRVPYSGGVYVTKQLSVTVGTPCAAASGCEEPSCGEPDVTTIWFLNTNSWADNVTFAYMWNGGTNNGPYPGAVMTRTDIVNKDSKRLYYITFDKNQYVNVKFNCNSNNDGCYTNDLTIEPFQCYNFTSGWVNRPCSVVVATDVNSYSTSADPMVFKCNSLDYVARVNFATAGNHAFKIVATDNGNNYWYGCNPGSTPTASFSNYAFSTSGGNMPFNADVPGEYYFEFNYATQTVSVIYPPYMTSAECGSSTLRTITLAVASTRGTKYHVVDATHGVNQIVTPAAGSITITGLTPGTEYTFTVTALDDNDTESANSVSATCSTTAPTTVPSNREDLDECRVLSVLGTTTYTPIGVTGYNDWGGGSGSVETIDSKNVVHIAGSNYLAVRHADKDVTFYTHLHLDIWMEEANNINLKLLCWGTGFVDGSTYAITTTAGAWKSLDIPLSSFNQGDNLQKAIGVYPVDLAGKDIYLANIYYYNNDAAKPVVSSASHGSVTGDELTLTLTGRTYKGDALNTFRVTNTTTSQVFDVTTNGSNQTTITGIRYCTAYTLNIQSVYHDCVLSDVTALTVDAAAIPDGINIIPVESVTATASHQETGYEPNKAIDGNDNSYWGSHRWITDEEWLNVDLGRILVISGIQVAWNTAAASNLYIEGSRDGVNYYRLDHIKTAPTSYTSQPNAIAYETYTLKSHIRIRHIRLRALNMTDEMSVRDIKVFGSCDAAYSDPVTTFALLESQEINHANTEVSATIEVGAYDYETAFGSMYYDLSITPTGGSTTNLSNQTASDGRITLTNLEPGTEYTVVITARDGNGGNLAENSVTVVFTTIAADPTVCYVEGGVNSGQSFAGSSKFTAGFYFRVRKGDPGKLLISAQVYDTDGEIGRVLLNFHSHSTNGDLYAEVELAAAAEHASTIVDREVTIPVAVADDEYASLSIKFEVGTNVRFTDRLLYNLKDGGCAPEYFDIYHWDDAPVGGRTSFDGGNIVLPIRYFRHFDENWTTISVPFEVERVAVYDATNDEEYPLFPRFHNNSKDVEGYYYLKTFPDWSTSNVAIRDFQSTWQQLTVATDYDGMDGSNISNSEEEWLAANVKPAKNTPYAIQFPYSGYYETNWVIFYGAAFQTIDKVFNGGTSITLTSGDYDFDKVRLQCNNTMKPSSALTQIYMLEENPAALFTRRESQAVPAFESYVIGTSQVRARYTVLRVQEDDPIETGIERPTMTTGAGEIYTISGIRVASFDDSEQMETLLNTINAGVYVVRVGTQINKVFVR